MTEPTPLPVVTPPQPESKAKDVDTIILRPWPKVIYFYPSVLTSLIVGCWQALDKDPVPNEAMGLIFFAVLATNIMVIAFEFSRFKMVSIFFAALAFIFLLLYLGTKWAVLAFIGDFISGFHISCSNGFYFSFATYLLLIYAGVFLTTRWSYFEVRHNEIVQRTGFLGDIRRFPSPNLKFTKEIGDVFEFMLLGSGRIILYPASEKEAIVLENVLNVNRAEREMKKLLSSIQVEVEDTTRPGTDEH